MLHFVKHHKIPWILKWQYEKNGDVLSRHWYMKWWGKFPHTQSIIATISREFLLLLLNPMPLLMLPLPLPPRMLSLQQKLRALLLMTWEKIPMLFLPYSNGRKKLLPIKEIPKPLLKNLSLTILMIMNCLAMMRTTLLILEKIDTICLACTTAKNATMFTY